MLTVRNLTVKKGRATLVAQASLDLCVGQLTVIIGPNGAGKTTLVRAVTGDEPQFTGDVRFLDRPLADFSPRELSQRIAYLPQQVELNFPFRVIEVVLLGRSPHYGFFESKLDGKIAYAALDLTGMSDFAERDYTTLSGGEKQRVSLARTLAQIWADVPGSTEIEHVAQPKLLVLDEPTNNLDLRHQLDTLQIAQAECRRGNAVLAILHDLNQAAHVADQLVVMKHGRIVTTGTPREVLSAELVHEVFEVPVVMRESGSGKPMIEIL